MIGNPPYGAKLSNQDKELCKKLYITAKTIKNVQKGSLDTYTLFIELGYNLLKKNSVLSYIVPISFTSSDALTGIHKLLLDNCRTIRVSSYAVRPEPVFENAVVNTSIVMFNKTETKCQQLFSTKMHRKKGADFNLQNLIDHLQFVEVKDLKLYGRIPKISLPIERNILQKVFNQTRIETLMKDSGNPIYYRTSGGRYFKIVTNYSTGSTKEKPIFFDKDIADVVGCILSSNLSFWFYQIFSNNLDWKGYEIGAFTIPKEMSSEQKSNIKKLYQQYLDDVERNANIRHTTTESKYLVDTFKEYKIVKSKVIIDRIDDLICPLYGLNKEETEFIKNYELVFRMSGDE